MSLSSLRDALPSYAADLKDNLDDLADDRELSTEERWGCFVACACAAGEPTTLRELLDGAAEPLGERGTEAAKAAAAVTVMNNIYYGATGTLKNSEYATSASGLRMEALEHPAVDRTVFELWCLAVSALNGCAPCMDAQEEELRRRAAPPSRIQTALRIAAVTGAVARVLAAEAAIAGAGSGDDGDEDGEDAEAGAQPKGGDNTADATGDEDGRKEDEPRPPPSPDALAQTPHPAPAPGDVAPG